MTPLEMPSRMAHVVLAATLALAIPAAAWAQQPAETGWVQLAQSQLRLVGGTNPSAPGERVLLLEMTLQPNWKTYWRMPGDSGIPPSFDWTGSTNIGNAEVRYPAPAMYVDQAGRNIGYKTAVVFPIGLKPEDPAKRRPEAPRDQGACSPVAGGFPYVADTCAPDRQSGSSQREWQVRQQSGRTPD